MPRPCTTRWSTKGASQRTTRASSPGVRSAGAFELLVDLGLLILDRDLKAYLPVDPTTVQARIVAPMGQEAAHLLEESSRWADAFGGLGQAYRRSLGTRHPVTEIRGIDNIRRFLVASVDDAQHEILTAQPTLGRYPGSLENASERDIRAVQRGIAMRTLYQHSARRSLAIKEYVATVSQHGAQVRTLEEFFNRMIVIDRLMAIVPGAEGNDVGRSRSTSRPWSPTWPTSSSATGSAHERSTTEPRAPCATSPRMCAT